MKPTPRQLKEHASRRAQMMQRIGKRGVAVIPGASEVIRARDTHYKFRQDSDFQYLTGFPEPDAIAVLVPGRKQGAFVLFVRPRDAEREIWDGRRAGPDGAMRDYGADQAFELAEFEDRLPELLSGRDHLHYTLGEHAHWDEVLTGSVRQIREVSRRGAAAPVDFIALETTLHEMRLIKSASELKILQRACEISAEAHCLAMRKAAPGVNEWQVAAEIEAHFGRHNMQCGYGSIVGGGENACILHYIENDAPLKDGDLLLIDAGGELDGYTADITRTFPVNGKFSAAQQAVYEIVLEANKRAIKELKVGASSGRPHEVATRILTEGLVDLKLLKGKPKDLIAQGKQRQFYMHGTGHWLGMDVHDVGRYKIEGKPRPFEAGMVMTVEPGLYIAPGTPGVPEKYWGIGIRIEDDVVVTANGPQVLTAGVPKERREIEALMRGAV
ncbi:M24 family metallopeptidase [Sinimarinibacterium sp. CAU 1509]|uniref:aminopeptidase P N-terminal domain-containing protein n=1 Tax=Sinimarinibacterium sp. CAU 1509 TaxID=2562283 RepID=UPI0010ABBA92|nr:aminopeptidase P N-terminal domain-containing protein [Sinimarinibacterium sp. CAU 1509]TJY61061.1 M24 family metallopeptidase [Sinimarinibacterium sp. CAU 1509]